MKKLVLTSAFAIAVAFGGAAQAQQQGLQTGWNHVKPTNCLYEPGTPAAGTVAATPSSAYIFVNIVVPTDPTQPPPVPETAEFVTTDPIAIGLAGPFCKDGSPFWVYWDGAKATYFSIYPK